jgi:hypothetical protein
MLAGYLTGNRRPALLARLNIIRSNRPPARQTKIYTDAQPEAGILGRSPQAAAGVSTPIALTMPEQSEKRLERFLTNSAEAHKPEYILRMFEAIKGRKATFEEVATVTRKFTPRPRKRK